MPSSLSLSPAALKAIFASLSAGRTAISAGYAAFALISFDFLLTLSAEVSRMWQPRKKTLVFYLFVTLRYATIFYQMTFSMSFFLPFRSNKSFVCKSIIYVEQVCFILSSSALSGVFALRTFAIYQRNWYILGGLIFLAAVKVFISAIDFFVAAQVVVQSPAFRQFGSCSETITGSRTWNTASASLALAFDTIVLGLTLGKTVRTSLRRQKLGLKKSYSYYIIRDGLLYYIAIEILLLFTVIFNQVPSLSVKVARVVIILQTSLAPALAQRLVLNLRSLDDKINASESVHSQPLPPIDFAHGSFIGNIGAPLRVGEDIDEGLEESEDSLPDEGAEGFDGIQMVMIPDEKGSPNPANTTVGFVL